MTTSLAGSDTARKLLFLCTGNYYRSRFAELYCRHLVAARGIRWVIDSRGLEPHESNPGKLSSHTVAECQRLGIAIDPDRYPLALQLCDLTSSSLVIALKEDEHRSLMRWKFPDWEDRIEYWQIHDLDVATPEETLGALKQQVSVLVDRLAAATV